MAFHEDRFPASLSFGSLGGPERRTEIVELSSGYEQRNTPWSQSRRRYDAGMGLRSLDDVAALIAFFEARQGQVHGFRWKDWADYKSCLPSQDVSSEDQQLGTGDDLETQFSLVKRYGRGESAYTRLITKPVAGTIRVAVSGEHAQEGIDWEVDLTTGTITFTTAPARDTLITAGFEFDVPVRFDTDRIHASVASFESGQVPEVPVVEVRV